MSISKKLLVDGIYELYDRNKISSDLKTEAETYIDNLSLQNVQNVKYSDFNQTDSTGVTFDDASRTVSWDTGSAELITNALTLTSSILDAVKLKATDQDIQIQISYNGTTWYNINDTDINEEISGTFYLKLLFTSANDITGMILIYSGSDC